MQRLVKPELLDSLPPDDPRARRSRRDLRRINAIMRQAALMAAPMRALPAPDLVVDLGSGDGKFLLGVARRLRWIGVDAILTDRQNIVSRKTHLAFEQLRWSSRVLQGDVFDIVAGLEPTVKAAHGNVLITANLFLHHFQDEDLRRLLALVASRAGMFIACEPRRSHFALLGARLTGLIGANDVTRHDAAASVRAGFLGKELTSLWPQTGWHCQESSRFPFTHSFVATKIAF